MVFRKTFRRKFRKRTFRKYNRKYKTKSKFNIQIGFPKTRYAKMRYVQYYELDLTTAQPSPMDSVFLSANSVYQPDSVNHGLIRPNGYPEMENFYNEYIVIGSKITIQGVTANSGTPVVYGILLTDDTSNPVSDWRSMVAQGRSAWRLLQTAINGNVPGRAVLKYSPRTWFGIKDYKDNQDEYGASFGANPNDQAYFQVWAQHQDVANVAASGTAVRLTVTIDYLVYMSEPKELEYDPE